MAQLTDIADHIIPSSLGGGDDLDNLQAVCGPCHVSKTAAEAARPHPQSAQAAAARASC